MILFAVAPTLTVKQLYPIEKVFENIVCTFYTLWVKIQYFSVHILIRKCDVPITISRNLGPKKQAWKLKYAF